MFRCFYFVFPQFSGFAFVVVVVRQKKTQRQSVIFLCFPMLVLLIAGYFVLGLVLWPKRITNVFKPPKKSVRTITIRYIETLNKQWRGRAQKTIKRRKKVVVISHAKKLASTMETYVVCVSSICNIEGNASKRS